MVSVWGRLGEICRYYGYDIDTVLWRMPWAWLQRMMADALHYETAEEVKNDEKELKPQDAEAFAAMINEQINNNI